MHRRVAVAGLVVAVGLAGGLLWWAGRQPPPIAPTPTPAPQPTPRPTPPETLTLYDAELPTTLSPLFAETDADRRAQSMVFDWLWRPDGSGGLASEVVERAWVAEGGRALGLVLHDGATWHDGFPLQAEDVCFTVTVFLARGAPALAGCTVEAPLQALVHLSAPSPVPQEWLQLPLLPAHLSAQVSVPDSDFHARPVGSGPYRGAMGRRSVRFEAAPDRIHSPGIAALELRAMPDPMLRARLVAAEPATAMVVVEPPYREVLAASEAVRLVSTPEPAWWGVAVSPRLPLAVREALDRILDRGALRQQVLGIAPDADGPCRFVDGPLAGRTLPHAPEVDLDAARALLREAGLHQVGGLWHQDDAPVTLRLAWAPELDVLAPGLREQIAVQLRAAGLSVQIVEPSPAEAVDLLIVRQPRQPDGSVRAVFGAGGADNRLQHNDPQLEPLLDRRDAAASVAARQAADAQIQARLAATRPHLFLWELDQVSAWPAELASVTILPTVPFAEAGRWRWER